MWRATLAIIAGLMVAACQPPSALAPERPPVTATATPPGGVTPTTGPSATARPPITPVAAASATPTPSDQLLAANSAFERGDYSLALGLYRQLAALDRTADQADPLRTFARFRLVVADSLVAQEDDARQVLEQMRQQEAASPYTRLALLYWDTYGMTADTRVACRQVNQLVLSEPELLRPLNAQTGAGRELRAEDVCPLR